MANGDGGHIKEYWEEQGRRHGDSHWASWGDHWMLELEIETIGRWIKDGDRVLDIGCANGYAAFRQAAEHRLRSLTGVDLAASMVRQARRSKAEKGLGEEIDFMEGDVRALPFADHSYDLVYTTRVLINLPTWEQQRRAIAECLRVVRPGGTLVLSEGFWEPLTLLNAMRALKGLPPLVEHDFNRYLKMARLEEHLRGLGLDYQVDDFSSVYYLGSRFLRELVTDPAAWPGFSNPVNSRFYELEKEFSGGGFGVQQAVIIHRPGPAPAESA